MKAVVTEIRDEYAALLLEDGSFIKVKNKNYLMGEVLEMNEIKVKKSPKFIGWVSAAAVFVMMLGVGLFEYSTPYYYLSMDVNPGVVMEVNRFERVIGLEAVNEDGEMVIEQLQLKNKNAEEAVQMLFESIDDSGYFSEGGNVYIGATSENQEKALNLANELQEVIEEKIEENDVKAEVFSGAIGYEMVKEAKELEITPGKLNIITNVLGQEPTDENIKMSIKDLMSKYKNGNQNKNQEENGKPDDVPANNASPTGIENRNKEKNMNQIDEEIQNQEQVQNQEQEQEQVQDPQANQEQERDGEQVQERIQEESLNPGEPVQEQQMQQQPRFD
ncbi:anti-sigma factor domain-containing protein [Alkalibacter mobilis]|uniref:anti-sigma factor domain-containing protein n=1 Tax=Alkalibacter mobilis TaxID=2787712 RepID=UPI00189F3586|nr:anti-sigma factor domain-containing protein [Alkalibacter mobilis]MBF7097374.1 anti-sigma factor domain-containing protein [Alkalibacter mobilis]